MSLISCVNTWCTPNISCLEKVVSKTTDQQLQSTLLMKSRTTKSTNWSVIKLIETLQSFKKSRCLDTNFSMSINNCLNLHLTTRKWDRTTRRGYEDHVPCQGRHRAQSNLVCFLSIIDRITTSVLSCVP